MEKYKWNYDYVTLKEGERQYNDVDLNTTNTVNARYVSAELFGDRGNPFIEALPPPRSDEEIIRAYTIPLETVQESEIKNWDKKKKQRHVSQLKNLRVPLLFHRELEERLYDSLLTSYRARYLVLDNNPLNTLISNDEHKTITAKLYGDDADSAYSGFTLLGFSGCGKSSSLKILLSPIPQVIYHYPEDMRRIIQIVYLVVNCIPNSNFSALYESIGAAIDKALGYVEPVFEECIRKAKGLGKKADKVRELIEKYAIGIILFDEIQLIDFSSTKENSFESLLTLCNRTKVAFGIIGTEDAYDKMFTKLRTARRTGPLIKADKYCSNKVYFTRITQHLFNYQWTEKKIELNQEIVDTLFEVSRGIIDQLIQIYAFMQIDYIQSGEEKKINSEFIRKVVTKHFPGMQQLLNNLDIEDFESKRQAITKKAKEELTDFFTNNKQEEFFEKISNTNLSLSLNLKENVIHNIEVCHDEYNRETILLAYDKVFNVKENQNKNEAELTKLTIKLLQKKPPTKKTTKLSQLQMDKYIVED